MYWQKEGIITDFLNYFIECFFVISIIILHSYKNERIGNGGVYEFQEQGLSINSCKIVRSNLTKNIRIYGDIKRTRDTIDEFVISDAKTLICRIGSIINTASDIADGNAENNFSKGRVVDIVMNGDRCVVRIDRASNYIVKLFLRDSYSEILQDIMAKRLKLSIKNTYQELQVEFICVNYDYTSCQYILSYQVVQLDNYTYNGISVSGQIVEKEYNNATCIDVTALRDLTENYYAIVDRIVSIENDVLVIEELKFRILDTAGSKVIIDAEAYIGNDFMVYGYFQMINV